jgi:uncharacterized membrane protein
MNRFTFLQELERHLQDLPIEERTEALTYYISYFEEAGPDKEAEVIEELGSPRQVAQIIKGDSREGNFKEGFVKKGFEVAPIEDDVIISREELIDVERPASRDNSKTILFVLLAVFAIPIILSLLGSLIGISFGLFGTIIGLFAAVIGFAAAGIGTFFSGISMIGFDLPNGLFSMGVGLGMIVLGIFGVLLVIRLAVFLIQLVVKLLRKIVSRISERKVV